MSPLLGSICGAGTPGFNHLLVTRTLPLSFGRGKGTFGLRAIQRKVAPRNERIHALTLNRFRKVKINNSAAFWPETNLSEGCGGTA